MNAPSVDVNVIVAVPIAIPVTNPATETVATSASDVVQVPVCTAPEGSTEPVSCLVAPSSRSVPARHHVILELVALTSGSTQYPARIASTFATVSISIDPFTT